MIIEIYKNVTDAEVRNFKPKPQYVRGGYIFTCPICNTELNSHCYIHLSDWEIACEDHLLNEHHGWQVKRGCVEIGADAFEKEMET